MFEDDPEFDVITTEILNGARGKRASEAEAAGQPTGLVETIKTPVRSITEIIGTNFRNFKNTFPNYNYSNFSNFDPSYANYNSYNYNFMNGYNYSGYGDAADGSSTPEIPGIAAGESHNTDESLNMPLESATTDNVSEVEDQKTAEQKTAPAESNQ